VAFQYETIVSLCFEMVVILTLSTSLIIVVIVTVPSGRFHSVAFESTQPRLTNTIVLY
jgi:hypothetical protein